MRYLSVAEIAKKWDVSERSVRNYCAQGRVNGAFLTGKTYTLFYTFCGRYYAKINQVMPEKKNSQRLTKSEKLRNARLCNNDKSAIHLPRHSSFTINHTFANLGNTGHNMAQTLVITTVSTTKAHGGRARVAGEIGHIH